ncbi:GC-rich sequence DNA-binding factor 1-like protein [Euroglyphus maynei]|uniref:GC-rich sequence DNA-binding factor 1-like protein n=1 Tax=Euroglyphus maynei TaxID=6958 RepID=A0A1Y3AXY0_EURMA|nr:GC-rich sequence DNA-binding factor 1-like protein [Euroglyphus maynei]
MALTADFIPLKNEENETGNRLVRESDEDKSENGDDDDLLPNSNSDCDDHHDKDRIQFGNIDYESKEKEKFRERFRVAQQQKIENRKQSNDSKGASSSSDDDDDDDDNVDDSVVENEESEDEMDKWEREQIRKAVRMPNIYHLARSEMNNKFLTTMDDNTLINKLQVIHDNHSVVPIEIDHPDSRQYGNNIPSYITSDNKSILQNDNDDNNHFDSFNDRIHLMRKQIESTIEDNHKLLDRIEMDLKLSTNDIETYEADVSALTDEYNLYRNMFDFIRNLFDCINDKMAILDENERQMMNVYRQYARHKLDEHRNDIQDQNSISLYLIMNHKALSIQYSTIDEQQLNCILDVYNFDGDQIKRNRCYNRWEKLRKNKTKKILITNDNDDDSERRQSLDEELKLIQTKLDQLFEDTDDDFASIRGICKQFQQWKSKQMKTYEESFISEFLPKFLAYYIRYDFTSWNIFLDHRSNTIDLMDMDAIKDLIRYCCGTTNMNNLIDSNVIPTLIDNVILIKLIEMIEKEIWNPLSTRQTDRFVRFLRLSITNFPTLIDISENFSKLLQKIVIQMEKTIENDIFIPQMIPAEFFANQHNDQTSSYEKLVHDYVIGFFQHQYMETFYLMKNILSFRNIINENVLRQLVMEKLCFRYLLTSILRSADDPMKTFERINSLIQIIPNEWLKKSNIQINNHFNVTIQQLLDRSKSNPNYTDEIRQKFLLLLHQINR